MFEVKTQKRARTVHDEQQVGSVEMRPQSVSSYTGMDFHIVLFHLLGTESALHQAILYVLIVAVRLPHKNVIC